MKTYTYKVGILLMAFLAACTKPAAEPQEIDTPLTFESDYTLLMDQNSVLTTQSVLSSESGMVSETHDLNFPSFPSTEISYSDGNTFSFFEVTSDCKGKILRYDFDSGDYQMIETFLNLDACDLNITSIAHDNTHVFLSFIKSEVGKSDSYFVRIINLNDTESAVDVELGLKPMFMVPNQEKLFVLAHDIEITDENGIIVIDINGQSTVYEKLIGFNAKKIFKAKDGNIVISYPELHTKMNSSTFEELYTQYGETLRPNLYASAYYKFDSTNKLYYIMNTEEGQVMKIPAVYDFQANKATLYYFNNFLSEAKATELNIKSASAVGYDEKNGFILVGYQKNGNDNTGGLLRLTPSPNFTYVDNINLSAVPKAIIVQ